MMNIKVCGITSKKQLQQLEGLNIAYAGFIFDEKSPRFAREKMADEDLITRLVTLKGIGRWTVEMLLMFTLKRLDVLPADDFAVVEGYKRLKKLDTAPKRKQMVEIAKAWSPHRTVASWYLWRVPK